MGGLFEERLGHEHEDAICFIGNMKDAIFACKNDFLFF